MRSFIEGLAKTEILAKNESVYKLDWDLLSEMAAALNLVAVTMTKLQREDILLSDIYAEWLVLFDDLQKLQTDYSKVLLETIRNRFTFIFGPECHPMLACVWMDPRYQLTLSSDEKEIAMAHLLSLHERISAMKIDDIVKSDAGERQEPEDKSDSRLEKFMKAFEKESIVERQPIEMKEILESFNNMDRMPTKIDPRMYWRERKASAPQLYILSRVVFAAPGSQAAVERKFSFLSHTLTKFRNSLSDETLERILFMRSNSELFNSKN